MDLTAKALTVRFGAVVALDRVTAEFTPGTRTVIWGPAGSGKTTLLKALAGLLRPTSGQVQWDRADVAALSDDARRKAQVAFGMIFQTDALFDSLSVLDNVLLPLRKRKVPEAQAKALALEALEQVGLADAALKRPETLSGGMRKRVGVARAVVSKPQVLLADDPFAGLDPQTEASIARLLVEVSQGRTLLAALPDPVAALPVQRWVHLDAGAITEDGPPRPLA